MKSFSIENVSSVPHEHGELAIFEEVAANVKVRALQMQRAQTKEAGDIFKTPRTLTRTMPAEAWALRAAA